MYVYIYIYIHKYNTPPTLSWTVERVGIMFGVCILYVCIFIYSYMHICMLYTYMIVCMYIERPYYDVEVV